MGSPSVGYVPEVGRSPEFTFHSARHGMRRGIPMGDQGIPIPRPRRRNHKYFMRMVGPPGLEPGCIWLGRINASSSTTLLQP